MRGLIVGALLAVCANGANAQDTHFFQVVPFTAPDGRHTFAVLERWSGRLWIMTCTPPCVDATPGNTPLSNYARGDRAMEPVWYIGPNGPSPTPPPIRGAN
ncbi:hypothetical protein STAQ_33770 [Allostella sp. ATCC 35155]|nr:hypothetical protein STAQ_33770 [Stella sp. ATCC 35155]